MRKLEQPFDHTDRQSAKPEQTGTDLVFIHESGGNSHAEGSEQDPDHHRPFRRQ